MSPFPAVDFSDASNALHLSDVRSIKLERKVHSRVLNKTIPNIGISRHRQQPAGSMILPRGYAISMRNGRVAGEVGDA